MTEQNRAWRVYWKSFSEENFSQVELLLFVVNHAYTIPENNTAIIFNALWVQAIIFLVFFFKIVIPQQEENNIFDSKTGILSFENNYVYFSILRRPQTRNNVGETMLRTFATQGNVSSGSKICFPKFASREAEMFPKFV